MSLVFARTAGPVLEMPPFRLTGTIYATLLNHRGSLASLGDAVLQAPYKGAPLGVVLAVKPRNALVAAGGAVEVDDQVDELEVGASLGLVIGTTACAVAEADALDHVAGFLIVADCTVPRASHFRPQIRAMARDRSCVLGARVVPRAEGGDPDALAVRVHVDGVLVQSAGTGDHVRSAARLVADVSDFMTLRPGDVLLTGGPAEPPRVRAGARIAMAIGDLGRLEFDVARREAARAA